MLHGQKVYYRPVSLSQQTLSHYTIFSLSNYNAVSFAHYTTLLLSHSKTVSLSHYATIVLSHYTVLLPHSTTVSLHSLIQSLQCVYFRNQNNNLWRRIVVMSKSFGVSLERRVELHSWVEQRQWRGVSGGRGRRLLSW